MEDLGLYLMYDMRWCVGSLSKLWGYAMVTDWFPQVVQESVSGGRRGIQNKIPQKPPSLVHSGRARWMGRFSRHNRHRVRQNIRRRWLPPCIVGAQLSRLRVRGLHDRDRHCDARCVRHGDQCDTLSRVGYGMYAGLWRLRVRQLCWGIRGYFTEGRSIP